MANFDIWVPDSEVAPRVRQALRSLPGITLRTSLPEDGTWTFLVVWLDRLGTPAWTAGEKLVQYGWRAAPHPVCPIFIGAGIGPGKSQALALQQLATLSYLAGLKRVEPFVAPDGNTFRRMVLARKAGAEKRLIATASVTRRTLSVWSCEPKQYVVEAAKIPQLAAMSDEQLRRFTLSSSGSRLHWDEGDVDLNMATLLEHADPTVRKAHETEQRRELKDYAAAIKSLREARGLPQNAIAGLSERQVRRLEQGTSVPHVASLEKLAAAHGMTVDDYLAALAKQAPRRRRARRSE